jgi:hypothetical protein
VADRPDRPASSASRPCHPQAPSDADPNHHLWRNGRLWWIAFTVHKGHLHERVRFSLRTAGVVEARQRRDQILRLVARAGDCRISLRFAPRGRRSRSGSGRREVSHVA